MVVFVAQLVVDGDQALGVVGHGQLPGHADAAVQLDGLFGNKATGPAADELGVGEEARALRTVVLIGNTGRQDHHGRGLLQLATHVHHAMLQRLELTDQLSELLARAQVLEGDPEGLVPGPGQRRRRVVARRLMSRSAPTGVLTAEAFDTPRILLAGAVDMGIDLVTTYLPHIQTGTRVVIQTEDGAYVERAKD